MPDKAERSVPRIARLVAVLALGLTACGGSGNPLAAEPAEASGQVRLSPGDGKKGVDPDRPVLVEVNGHANRITDVTVSDAAGRMVGGQLADDGRLWRSTSPLAGGERYTVRVSTAHGDGSPGRTEAGFTTKPAGKSLKVTLAPSDGETYGVGQPITATLSHPVNGRAARAVVERGLRVSSTPAVVGSWYWVDARTLHYRPREYWPAHASIKVETQLAGVGIQQGLRGGTNTSTAFKTGDRVETLVDAAAHTMTVRRNGEVIRTVPVTTGKPGFETRNGIKVVLEKERTVRMRGTTIGIPEDSEETYDLDVEWATRVTWSGEYLHAAPWSVGSQGAENVSHGCTGMSVSDARWFFDLARRGDVVKVVGSNGAKMPTFGNGFGDWNMSWTAWRKGSALGSNAKARIAPEGGEASSAARLQPQP